ncbi:uncharacterized protein LTR77_004310 [Saxophila tyrrhenica]|uniref:RanBD1 domain-containing protein n=1 Tax=Saxophila tyrrhenica TaxID=1690608 RepID=A0AAV9PCT3_9PEZI|nr:hypothetical protein LTR77_004310 [Saxophila tyrrhenica]
MSKRLQETQGGEERYGGSSGPASMDSKPQAATAAQLAKRKTHTRTPLSIATLLSKSNLHPSANFTSYNRYVTMLRGKTAKPSNPRIAQARKPSGSQRNSRANTPNATPNPFANQQQQPQSMPSFQQTAQNGGGGGFNFSAGGGVGNNPFAQQQQNGTPPPTSFQFGGAPSQPPAQQNGGGGMFGGNSAGFGSTFGSNNAQPQQNGFNPSTSSTFGNQNNTNSGFSFGQSNANQAQQNGATPSTNASFPTFGTQNTDNPFNGFGQSQQQTQSTPSTSFGGFGQGSQEQNGDKRAGTPTFGGFGQNNSSQSQTNGGGFGNNQTPQTATSSVFGSFGQQQNGETSQAQETPKANTNSLFSGAQQADTSKSMFGSTPQPEPSSDTNNGVFLGLDSSRASTVKPGMFTSGQSETPKPQSSNLFSFGQQNGTQAKEQETPKPSNPFANFQFGQSQQANATKGTNEQQTPKPSNNLFQFGQSQQQSSTTPGFKSGQSQSQQEDASMTTPGHTPQKPSMFGAQASNAPSETPAGQGKSLFDRVSTPATAQKSFTPSTSLFNPSAANNSEQAETPAAQSKGGLFERINRDEAPQTAQKQTSFTPSTNLFNKSAASAAATPSAAPWISHAPPAPQTTVTPPTPKASATSKTTNTQSNPRAELLKHLNEGLLRHLATQDVHSDWTSIMKYYTEKATELQANGTPASAQETQTSTASGSSNMFGSQSTPAASNNMFGSATPKAQAPSANMFGGAASQQTPKPTSSSNMFGQPPATAPVNNKRPALFEEDDGESSGPATEKRARSTEPINYPKLPDNASATSKLFQAALDKSATASPAPTADSASRPPSSSSGFAPSNASTTAPAGMPTFTAPTTSGGFLSAFGKKASAEEEKAKKKRKAEDYDSDDETEEQWEARDREEQAAKRKKIEEAAKGASGFMLPGSSRTSSEPETPMGAGKGLFDRVEQAPPATAPSKPSMFASQTPAEKSTSNMFGSKTPAATSSSNMFGNVSKENAGDAEKDKDATWKPNTPIKFGGSNTTDTGSTTPAAPPPKFGNLFGSAAPSSSTNHLNIPGSKPSLGFNFGNAQQSASRATTPGVTTDGEGASTAGEEEDAAPTEPQLEDQTALLEEEKEKEDLLFSIPIAKASKWDEKSDAESGEITNGWVEKGKGPIYVLKNKETGKVRVLLKIKPLGKAAMNFEVLKGADYAVQGASGKFVRGPFVDHLAFSNAGKPTSWMVQVGKKEDAEGLAGVLDGAAKGA